MDRREFLHITALGSAAGVASFTGIGLLWDDSPDARADTGADSPTDRSPSTASPRPGTDDPGTERPTDAPTGTEPGGSDGTATESPATAESPPTSETESQTATESPTARTPTDGTAATETGTPEPWRSVDVRYRAYDEDRAVYINVENGNDYAVEVTVTVSWGFDDGSETSETRAPQLEAGEYWAEEVRADAGDRTVRSLGYRDDVQKL